MQMKPGKRTEHKIGKRLLVVWLFVDTDLVRMANGGGINSRYGCKGPKLSWFEHSFGTSVKKVSKESLFNVKMASSKFVLLEIIKLSSYPSQKVFLFPFFLGVERLVESPVRRVVAILLRSLFSRLKVWVQSE